jgi:hypothetical protein
MSINLHIDRLVLEGVNIAPDQRHLLKANVETELARLLAEGGLASSLSQGAALSRLSTSSIQLNGGSPMQLGRHIAQSVYGGIGHE